MRTIRREVVVDPSETTRQRLPELRFSTAEDDEIVRAVRRLMELHEQGSRRGTCGWITSIIFLIEHLEHNRTKHQTAGDEF